MTGLEPRDFTWVIQDRLAVSERIGGYGMQHRRVRREEEIAWLRNSGVTAVLSLLEGNQNLTSYEGAGLTTFHQPLADLEPASVEAVFSAIDAGLSMPGAVLLVHRDIIDEAVAGVLAGYLVHSGLLADPIVAIHAVQEILKRPLGPEARAVVPGG
jgi:hypothetical protein